MDGIVLALQRSPEQQKDLDEFLERVNNPASPDYQHWLTPEEFGARFGVAGEDLAAIEGWLGSQGFQVDRVAAGRSFIRFSGTAGAVRRAFGTSIRRYVVKGEEHWANDSDPQIPEALAPVVAGIVSLHDFHSTPQWTAPLTNVGSGQHALSPSDYTTIYNLKPVYNSGFDGTGSTIGIVARTNLNLQDIADFRSMFGLPANTPQRVLNGVDPGITDVNEEMEAVLDATWSGAVAPGARVKIVISKSTRTTDGVFLSQMYIVDNNAADIMSVSFGSCEAANLGAAAGISSLAQQAAAQGISVLVASGDSGAAGCDGGPSNSATGGLSVNVLSSPPYVTSVGGTQFNDTVTPSLYWRASNGVGLGSAIGHIPENVWNESCAAGQPGCSTANLWAGGGGASVIFSKPAWQTGVAGIPADGHRDVPDVSLTAASHDGYIVCMLSSCAAGKGQFYLIGGTSASTPAFSGMLALVRQKVGARLGLVNQKLYALAAVQSALSCDGSSTSTTPNSGCVFYDTTTGNNSVPGLTGYGTVSANYRAGAGFDLATGLGSVNAANLVNQWANANRIATTTTLTVNPTTFGAGSGTTVSVTVAANSGGGTPTGTVALLNGSGQTVRTLTLSGGAVVATESAFPPGSYNAVARYSGDSTYAGSDSAGFALTVTSPVLGAGPTSFDFGGVNLGNTSSSQTITVTNTGAITAYSVAISANGTNASDFLRSHNCPATLAPAASCTVTVSFRPAGVGARSANLTVGAFGMSTLAVPLAGSGIGSGRAQLSRTSAIFGSVNIGARSTDIVVTLSSTGSAPVSAISIGFTGAAPGDYAQTTTCGSSLAPAATCTITVAFVPTAIGSRTANLSVSSSASASPLNVSLAGTGLAAIPTPSISSITGTVTRGVSGTITVNGANFLTGLSARITTPSGTVTLQSSAITVVSASQVKLQVLLTGSSAYTATLSIQNAGNAQATTKTFAVK
jgi:subtilase family serine protease